MIAPSSIVAALARMLDVLDSAPNDRELLKAAFRDLYAVLEPAGAAISVDVKGMIIDGTPLPHGLPGGSEVETRFHAHGIGAVRVPAGVKPADLLAVVHLLAAAPIGEATAESFVSACRSRPRSLSRWMVRVSFPKRAMCGPSTISAPQSAARQPTRRRPRSPRAPHLIEPDARVRRDQPDHDPLRDIEVKADLAYRREEWDELLGLATEVLRLEGSGGMRVGAAATPSPCDESSRNPRFSTSRARRFRKGAGSRPPPS